MASDWCTIESDPGVFTALCEEIGVKGVLFEEVYSLDLLETIADDPSKIYGLIFLFKWDAALGQDRPTVDAADHGLFFAQQVIQNACATQAILSVLMNVPSEKLDIGPTLKEFKEFVAPIGNPEMMGLAISNSDVIRVAHNSFRHQSSFEIVQEKDAKGEDAFHFVGFLPHDGKVYELDGLKKGPVLIGDAGAPFWMTPVKEDLQRRIDSYQNKASTEGAGAEGKSELRFNLMAIVADKKTEAEKLILKERYTRQRASISLVSRGEDFELNPDDPDDDPDESIAALIPSFEDFMEKDVAEVHAVVKKCGETIDELQKDIDAENKKRQQWAKENKLRRTDLVPLALAAMRHLARTKQLVPAFEKGKAAHLKRVEEKKAAAA